jgi:hypothetical protein
MKRRVLVTSYEVPDHGGAAREIHAGGRPESDYIHSFFVCPAVLTTARPLRAGRLRNSRDNGVALVTTAIGSV